MHVAIFTAVFIQYRQFRREFDRNI